MKKLFAVLMCVALLSGLFPAFCVVDAAVSPDIYVGNVLIPSGGYLLQGASYAINESALPSDFDFDNDSYAYVNDNDLYLVNFTYNGAGYGASGERKAAIRSTSSIFLILAGNNSISCTTSGAVAVKASGRIDVLSGHFYYESEYAITPTLTVTATNGFMVEDAYNVAYDQYDVKITLNIGQNGRGIMISDGADSDETISVMLVSGYLTVNGYDNNATAGIEVICTDTSKSFLQNQVTNLSIKGCYRGVIVDDVELIDGTVKVSTTGGYGITATKGSINIRSTEIDIYVDSAAYDAMHAGKTIARNTKTCEIYSGDYSESTLRIKPKKYVVVGDVYLNNGEYLANGASSATTTKPSGGYAYYTDGTLGGKLELYNYSYQGVGDSYPDSLGLDYSDSYNACVFSPYNIELVVKGTNTFKVPDNAYVYTDGIVVYGSLAVSGNGKLTVEGSAGYAVYVMANQMTLGAEFIVNSGFLYLENVYVESAIKDNGAEFTVNGGECNIKGTFEIYSEYNSFSRMNVNGGTVNITNYNEYNSAIDLYSYAEAVYTQTDGTVNISGAEYGTAFSSAISAQTEYGNGVIEFSGGEFTASGVPSHGTFVTDSFYLNDPMKVVEGDYDAYYIRLAVSAAYITGDVNNDGEVDSSDATMILKYDAGMIDLADEQMTAGDVNRDGAADSGDATLVLKYDAGMIDSL